ncbi:MAG: glycosyltransferase family 4 protein [Candidatus Omnitrophica bacterium]|nr:glycosyltransferase family 4 protein [Candidatus Omnitrophota bacterium]
MNTRDTKKVVHILWSGGIGGIEEYTLTLLKHFDYSKYKIYLCILSERGLIFKETNKLSSIHVTFINMKNGFDMLGAFRFIKYLRREKFDIIHSNMRNFLSTAVLGLFTYKTPKILTHHLSPGDLRRFKKNKLFYRLFSKVFSRIIGISNATKNFMINNLDVKHPHEIEVIHFCIDLNKFNKSSTIPSDLLDQESNKYIIGFIGRMVDFKRPYLFIEIANELLTKNNFYFLMIGDGPELEKCKQLIHHYKIDEHFKLLGFRRDIPDILRLFDALLFTSAGEGFGLVLIEAMAMGIPIFAINEGAVPEIINHKDNGILLNTTDPKLIAKQILEVIEDKTLIDKIKKQCIKDIHSKFSPSVCVQKLENVYEKL